MKKEKIAIDLDDEFTVDFFKNERGIGRPICKVEGIVGFIDDSFKEFVAPGSTWIVKVVCIKPKTLIVSPIIKIRTPKENFAIMAKKVEELKAPKKKKEKVKKTFQYLSKQEFQQLKTQK